MARSGWSSSNLIRRTSGILTAAPLTMACWFNPASISPAAPNTMMSLCRSAETGALNQFRIAMNVGAAVFVQAGDGSSFTTTTTSTTVASANTWNHACGVVAAADDRRVFLNGGGKATSAVSRIPSGIDRNSIGTRDSAVAATNDFGGALAECALWDAALTDEEVAILALGYSPLLVRPQNLYAYLPLVRDVIDYRSGDFSAVGSLTVEPHTRVFLPD
jgi:hypothetical protein